VGDTTGLSEAYRLAQTALSDAKVADHKAESALSAQAGHEKLCAERYGNIDRNLGRIELAQKEATQTHYMAVEKIYTVLNELRTTNSEEAGGRSRSDTLFRYSCLLIGAVWTLILIAEYFK
jgi:hypothetical protein